MKWWKLNTGDEPGLGAVRNAYENSSINLNVTDRLRPTNGRKYNEKALWQYSLDSSGSGYILKENIAKACPAGRGISSSLRGYLLHHTDQYSLRRLQDRTLRRSTPDVTIKYYSSCDWAVQVCGRDVREKTPAVPNEPAAPSVPTLLQSFCSAYVSPCSTCRAQFCFN